MIFGSHNSWSFRRPIKWFLKPLHFMAKCQSKDIYTQYNDYNIRIFDLRIKFIDNIPYIHHGFFNFGKINDDELLFLNNNNCYVRIILESNKEMKDQDKQEKLFIEYTEFLQNKYPNITLFCGARKYDGKIVVDLSNNIHPSLIELYSSVTTLFDKTENKFLRIIDDWFPKLYALLRNKKNYQNYIKDETLHKQCFFYDFVEIK